MKLGPLQLQWLNKITHCYRKNNLVYFAHPKCGSTYYNSLLEHNNWTQIEFNSVNWDQDQVFSFFMDPVIKHAKGLTEELYNVFVDKLKQDPTSADFLFDPELNLCKRMSIFGWHTMPVHVRFQDYYDKMIWIPIDLPVSADQLFKKLLDKHSVEFQFSNRIDKHRSDIVKQEFYKKVCAAIGNGNAVQYQVLSKDIDLYNQVVSNINPYADDWDEIYKLRNTP